MVHQRLFKIVYGASMGIAQTAGKPNILHIIMINDVILNNFKVDREPSQISVASLLETKQTYFSPAFGMCC